MRLVTLATISKEAPGPPLGGVTVAVDVKFGWAASGADVTRLSGRANEMTALVRMARSSRTAALGIRWGSMPWRYERDARKRECECADATLRLQLRKHNGTLPYR
jgi:hypothetical protein